VQYPSSVPYSNRREIASLCPLLFFMSLPILTEQLINTDGQGQL
jgi:hypothetical protein